MAYEIEIGDRTLASEELMTLLTQYNMMPQFLREILIDRAIAQITCTREEISTASQHFFKQHQISNSTEHEAWLKHYNLNHKQFQALITRKLRIEKFQQETWGNKLESYFLHRKPRLDRVIYSLIRTQELGIANELYFRILAGEQTFAEVAREYSTGPEANTNGIVGPVDLESLHPGLAKQLQVSQPGQLWRPIPFGEFFVIIRLEKLLPAQLDKFMQQRLLKELFESWLQEQIHQLSDRDKAWMMVTRKQPQEKSSNAA
ncbi:peptidylprolyl isomerase [Scytonema sp. NUACC26]|uniref:peptidylprolyl isomerase n=1 Tax=Scytonema sp. NUACC26 TaxID=3140176 RepID=UPI0034DC64CE